MTTETTHDDIDTLARTLWGEARGEGQRGIHAVACVIMHRAKRPGWWGHDVVSVCRKPFQFSCWLHDDPNRGKIETATADNDPTFGVCIELAKAAIAETLPDITSGATHYCVIGTDPAWAKQLTETVRIGRHVFYR